MASNFRELNIATGLGNIAQLVEDRPLTADENLLFDLARRRVSSGFFDTDGLFNQPSGGRAQPQAVTPAPSAAPGIAPSQGTNAPALTLTHVQPGDLITAGFCNGLIDALLVLDRRLRTLETRTVAPSAAPTIPATPAAPAAPSPSPTPAPSRGLNVVAAGLDAVVNQKSLTLLVKGNGIDPADLTSVDVGNLAIDMKKVKPGPDGIKILLNEDDIAKIGSSENLAVTLTNEKREQDTALVKIGLGSNPLLRALRGR